MKRILCFASALAGAAIGFGATPTPEQAVDNATSVVLVKRVMKDNLIHAYVKEVWRSAPGANSVPTVGSEYGRPMPHAAEMRFPERDTIVFEFGLDRPKGMPNRWQIPVTEEGRVPSFSKIGHVQVGLRSITDPNTTTSVVNEPMTVDEVRTLVESHTPKAG